MEDGDILNVDVTTALGGKHGDTSQTFLIGSVSPQARLLVDVARRCRDAGVAVVRPGARLGDIGAAIVETARAAGMGVVADYEQQMVDHGYIVPLDAAERAGFGPGRNPTAVYRVHPVVLGK